MTLNDVPIDVLAERLNTTRGALDKTVHDARRKLRGAFRARARPPLKPGSHSVMTPHQQTDRDRVLARLLGPAGPELTCEECFEQLDHYVELELADAQADQHVPGMRAHLESCPACADDHDSLLAFVTQQHTAGR